MAAMTNEIATAGPVTSPATRAVMVKIPAPMRTATPNTMRSRVPSSRRSLVSGSSVSAMDCSTDLVRKSPLCGWVDVMGTPEGPTGPSVVGGTLRPQTPGMTTETTRSVTASSPRCAGRTQRLGRSARAVRRRVECLADRGTVGTIEVGLEVDQSGLRHRVAQARLGVVDRLGDRLGRQRRRDGDLGRDQQLLGAEVLGAQVDHPLDGPADQRAGDRADQRRRRALADEQALRLDDEDDRDDAQQDADADRPQRVEDDVAGQDGQPDAPEGQDQADEGAEVLEEDDGQLGVDRGADEAPPRLLALELPRLLDGGAEAVGLQGDGDDEDGHG